MMNNTYNIKTLYANAVKQYIKEIDTEYKNRIELIEKIKLYIR